MKFEMVHTEPIYQGRVFSVRRDQVRLPDGAETTLDIVEHGGAVTILPLDSDQNIWFVRQYRHAVGVEMLELPAGGLEPAETPEFCAQREIREEIGMKAGKIQKLGAIYLAPGYSTEYLHIFLATDLSSAPLDRDIDEFLSIERIPMEQVSAMIRSGEIIDAKSSGSFSNGAN